jgi:hypothetical protein
MRCEELQRVKILNILSLKYLFSIFYINKRKDNK